MEGSESSEVALLKKVFIHRENIRESIGNYSAPTSEVFFGRHTWTIVLRSELGE